MRSGRLGVLVGLCVLAAGCDGGSGGAAGVLPDAGGDVPGEVGTPTLALEAARLGLDRYLGEGPEPTVEEVDGDTTTFRFEPGSGPLCMRGGPFRFAVRQLTSERLVIFLQGGGACWSEFCLAVNAAPAGIPSVDALDRDMEANPLRDWSVVYLPYCDGSLFVGDADVDEDGDGAPDRFHHGLQNLSAALRKAHTLFPDPERVLLVGSSAGGFGTIPATVLVRTIWHEARIDVFNDSGVGVARPGDAAFIRGLLEEFDAARFIPDTCPDCVTSGHITPLVEWTLARDPGVRVAVFSSYYDSIIADVFLGLAPAVFRDALLSETDRVHAAFPDRYRRFFVDGVTHTAMLGDPTGIIGSDLSAIELPPNASDLLTKVVIGGLDVTTSGGVLVGDWLRAFVTDDPTWVERLETPGPPPGE
ncbi:MAG: hypothetical protein H6744_09555 [Deltaproteobacteria bacterium]|nr:hypothetical protein [Deltaproteobacteria bacterium]